MTVLRGQIVLAMVMFVLSLPVFGQGAPFGGAVPAEVTLTPSETQVVWGDTFTVDVHVDLRGITGTCNASTPDAVLSGYTIPIGFNSSDVEYVSASACTSAEFSSDPTATDAATANANGEVVLVATQTSQTAPANENVCVARVTFQAVSPSYPTTLTTDLPGLNLISTIMDCPGGGTAGPAPIPAEGGDVTLEVASADIPALSPMALLLLAFSLGVAAFVTLRH